MAAQMNGTVPPPALYTVEQLELIRRLRNSGISREDVANAFEAFDRLDRELGPVYNIPVTLALQAQALQLMALGVANGQTVIPVNAANNQLLLAMQPGAAAATNGQLCNNIKPVTVATPTATPVMPMMAMTSSSLAVPLSTAAVVMATSDTMQQHQPIKIQCSSVPASPAQDASVSNAARQQLMEQLANTVTKNGSAQDSDINEEMIEFMRKGETACCEEIKAFAIKHNIKQQQIAVLAGICQSYVSRYMKGDIFDMSERSRHAIQKWYLIYRKNPAAIAVAANAATLLMQNATTNGGPTPPKKFLGAGALDFAELASNAAASGDLSFPRRERFVFRPTHIEVLERFFQDNNYPSYETREEIANMCNVISETAAGRPLTEREKVTAQIISNWFANKRKELKKLAREEGLIDGSLVPLRQRGHPSRLYSDLALIQQIRTGIGQSCGMDMAVTSSSVERSPASDGGATSSDPDDRRLPAGSESGDCRLSGFPMDGDDDDEQSLNWSSVEMVAVNQAILSLTGQQPIDVTLPAGFLRSMHVETNGESHPHGTLDTPPPPAVSNGDVA